MPNSIADGELSHNLELQGLCAITLCDNPITHIHKSHSM
jgi:hypothetical protein